MEIGIMKKQWLAGLALSLLSGSVFAAQYTGSVSILEVWKSGNVAFSLIPAIPGCNSQVILNASAAGTKNQYAALLAAKTAGTQVSVYVSGTCIQAEGYGGGYHDPLFIYALDP
jgi:hypothetical protein